MITTEQAIRELVFYSCKQMQDLVIYDMTRDWDLHGQGCFKQFILHLFPAYWVARARQN